MPLLLLQVVFPGEMPGLIVATATPVMIARATQKSRKTA
jgi:hypothetical protein